MEKKVSLFIVDNQVSFETDNIKGYLNSVIIDSNDKVDIIIESSLGYLLLKETQIIGQHYLCPRARTQAPEKSLFDHPGWDKILLNESMIITINGPKNTTTNFLFRID
jgi:hypothetical protein